MSSNNIIKNEDLIKNIDLEMKSEHNTNSDIISLDDMPKKIIISDNCISDRYTEIKFTKQNSTNEEEDNTDNNNMNIDTGNKELKEKLEIERKSKDIFGDLTSIIKDKIKTRNTKDNNKKKKIRLLSASSALSTNEKKKKINFNMNLTSRTNLQTYKNKNKSKPNSSAPKNKNSKILKKPKKNPEIFVNKNKNNSKNSNTIKKEEAKKINFKEVLKRFDEEKKTAMKRFDMKKKEIKNKENLICTGKPKISKKIGNKYDKFSKDFLIRQKELNDNLNMKKKKLIEEDHQKKEKEYKKIINDSIITKKMKKYKKNKSTEEWVEGLYKEDPKKRIIERNYLQNAYLPTFHPYLPKKRLNNSVEKINQIGEVLDKYNEKQNPQLLIDYFSRNNTKFEESENLFRQRILNKFVSKKKRNNSTDIKTNKDNNDENNEESD